MQRPDFATTLSETQRQTITDDCERLIEEHFASLQNKPKADKNERVTRAKKRR